MPPSSCARPLLAPFFLLFLLGEVCDATLRITNCCVPGYPTPCHENTCNVAFVDENTAINTIITNITINAKSVLGRIVGDNYVRFLFKLENATKADTPSKTVFLVKVREQIDAETLIRQPSLQFLFSNEASTISTTLNIKLQDVDDNAPSFSLPTYRCEIFENQPKSTCNLTLLDRDSITTPSPVLSLSGSDASSIFSVGFLGTPKVPDWNKNLRPPLTWIVQVSVNSPVDFEKNKFFSLKVQAVVPNLGFSAQTELMISVKDVADEPPVFSRTFTGKVAENSPQGTAITTVTAYDGDQGIRNPIQYSIPASNKFFAFFAINADSGEITVKQIIDRENRLFSSGVAILEVVASEKSSTTQPPKLASSTTEVRISVTDQNDYFPTFNRASYKFSVSEDTQANIPLTAVDNGDIELEDKDLGTSGECELSLTYPNGSAFDIFKTSSSRVINKATILLRVNKPAELDFETRNSFSFKIVAKDLSPPHNTRSADISVAILNANDNLPQFSKSQLKLNVTENAAAGTEVGAVVATDADLGKFGVVSYELIGDAGTLKEFRINSSSGMITVAAGASLDREKRAFYFLNVMAQDAGAMRAFAQVQIDLLDANDNTPKFVKAQFEATLNENANDFTIPGLTIQAQDADNGPLNNAITYSISEGNAKGHFAINATSGHVSVATPVDYESLPAAAPIFNLTVTAKDAGTPSLTASTNLVITVEDVNDHPPIFANNYTVEVNETLRPQSNVVQVKATDGDKAGSPQAQLFYRIASGAADKFQIDGFTGWIKTLNPLKPDNFTLQVLAMDRGATPQTGTATVQITVLDVNDSPPSFSASPITKEVSENAAINAVLFTFRATDPDSSARLEYSLVKAEMRAERSKEPVKESEFDFKNLFSINNKGEVSLVSKLDREKADKIIIPIHVTDKAAAVPDPKQTAQGTVILIVNDVNDEFPVFLHMTGSSYSLRVAENLGVGALTSLTVQASDPDSDDKLTYGLNDPSNTFSIDSNSGQVRLNKRVDFEASSSLSFQVTVTDKVGHTSNATVQVTVTDVNDNEPQFVNFPTPAHVAEDAAKDKEIVEITASDKDSGKFGKLSFRLLNAASLGGKFVLKPKGTSKCAVLVAGPLDRETQDKYSLNIEVYDDPDEPTRSRKSSRMLEMIVDDVNDHSPVLSNSSYSFTASETTKSDAKVGSVRATDADAGVNAQLQYSLVAIAGSENVLTLFRMDSSLEAGTWVGAVMTKKALKNHQGVHKATLRVTDKGSPSKKAEAPIEIHVEDVNDFAPEFKEPTSDMKVVYVNESTVNKELVRVRAEDADPSGPNKQVRYRLDDANADNANFAVDSVSGVVTNSKLLDRESKPMYKLTIVAHDLGTPQLSSTLTLTVEVLDEDDNSPEFPDTSRKQNFTVPENSEPTVLLSNGRKGFLVGNVSKATDKDSGTNARICYFIVNKYFPHIFLDKHSGGLYLTRTLDRETDGVAPIEVVIKAVNGTYCETTVFQWQSPTRRRLLFLSPSSAIPYNPSDRSLSRVFLSVSDVNDNPPAFSSATFLFGLSLASAPGTAVMDFRQHVTDPDPSSGPLLRFHMGGPIQITGGLSAHLTAAQVAVAFELHQQSGVLSTGKTAYFSSAMKGYFHFLVNVTDGKYSDHANCTIYLINKNQQIRAVFRESTTKVSQFSPDFVRFLSNITGLTLHKDWIGAHVDENGKQDPGKSDMLLHAYDPKQKRVLSATELIRRLDSVDQRHLAALYNKYNAIEVKPAEQVTTGMSLVDIYRIALMATACGLGVLLLISCFCLWSCRRMYRRKLKAANIQAYGSANGTLGGVPGTTMDTYDGSNPIWVEQYDNWAMNYSSSSCKAPHPDDLDFGPSTNLDDSPPLGHRPFAGGQPCSPTFRSCGNGSRAAP